MVAFGSISEIGNGIDGCTIEHGIVEPFFYLFSFSVGKGRGLTVSMPGRSAVDGFPVCLYPLAESVESGFGLLRETALGVGTDVQQQISSFADHVCQIANHHVGFLVDSIIFVVSPVGTHGEACFPRFRVYLVH